MMTDTTTPATTKAAPYAIGTALDLPGGGTGYIVGIAPATRETFTIGAGMARDLWTLTYATETRVSELSENIAAPMIYRARCIPALSEAEAEALHQRATVAHATAREDGHARAMQAEARRAANAAEVDARRPAWASSAIIAELVEDQSDGMTDYYGSTTTRCVVLGWSRHDRDLFAEMRKAAATFPDTAHLADAPADAEHREKYSMGGGYYLKAGYRHNCGWRVSKTRADYLKSRCDLEWPAAFTAEDRAEAEADQVAAPVASGRFTVERHTNTRKGFQYWLCIMAERVERAEYDALLSAARALGGWYSRPWAGLPGGFAFKVEAKALAFVAGQGGGDDTPGRVAPVDQPAVAPAAPVTPSAGLGDRLRTLADGMAGDIAHKFADRRMNTPKQQRQAAEARQDGCDLERAAAMMRAVAALSDAGELPAELYGITTKAAFLRMATEKLDRSRCGYYDAGRPTGEPSSDTPAARTLWALVANPGTGPAAKAAELAAKIAKLRFANIPGYFPTPAPVVARMIEAARLSGGERVLEPSAGSGAIADAVRDLNCDVVCIEQQPSLVAILTEKGHEVRHCDFTQIAPPCDFDAVLMNPPFEKGQDLDHVRHALQMLRTGGRLVAIMSAAVEFRQDRKYAEFRDWLDQLGGEIEQLPPLSFKESGTGVSCVMVTLDRD